MDFHDQLRQMMVRDKSKIELFRWATTAAVSSLVYSEYIKRFRRKLRFNGNPPPGQLNSLERIDVPPVHYVQTLLDPSGQWMERISSELINGIISHKLMRDYGILAPEMTIFKEENLEILRCVFDAHVIPSVRDRLTTSISQKFGLTDTEEKKYKIFYENREIDLFDRKPLTNEQMKYLINETVLNMLLPLPSIEKIVEEPEDYSRIPITPGAILTVDHKNAICPIHFNEEIMTLHPDNTLKLVSFVTSTTFKKWTGEICETHHGVAVHTYGSSSPFNTVRLSWIVKVNPENSRMDDHNEKKAEEP